jgi:hypothetical protein
LRAVLVAGCSQILGVNDVSLADGGGPGDSAPGDGAASSAAPRLIALLALAIGSSFDSSTLSS